MRLLLVLWLLLLTACGGRRAQQIAAFGQIIALDGQNPTAGCSDTVRFGHLGEGEQAFLPLLLHNTTERPLLIRNYERTCGCTTLEFDPQPIMPDEQRPATLRFDARGAWGWQLKLLTLHIEGLDRPLRILVEAEVE